MNAATSEEKPITPAAKPAPKKRAPAKRKPAAKKPVTKEPVATTPAMAEVRADGPARPPEDREQRATPKAVIEADAPPVIERVLYISVEKETVSFDFGPIPAMRMGERLAWLVPKRDAHKFDRHHWCQIGRIRRARDEELPE